MKGLIFWHYQNKLHSLLGLVYCKLNAYYPGQHSNKIRSNTHHPSFPSCNSPLKNQIRFGATAQNAESSDVPVISNSTIFIIVFYYNRTQVKQCDSLKDFDCEAISPSVPLQKIFLVSKWAFSHRFKLLSLRDAADDSLHLLNTC